MLGAASSLHPTSRQQSRRKSLSQAGRGQLQKRNIHGALARSPNCAIAAWGPALVADSCKHGRSNGGQASAALSTAERLGTLAPPHALPPLPALPPNFQ